MLFGVQSDIIGVPRDIQHLTTGTSAAYSVPIERGTKVCLVGNDAHLVKVVREEVFGGFFGASRKLRANAGSNIYDRVDNIFESDDDGAELRSDGVWDISSIVTNVPVLDTGGTTQDCRLQFKQDDQDDVIKIALGQWIGRHGFPGAHLDLPAATPYILRVGHIDEDAGDPLEWAIVEQYDNEDSVQYWNDSGGSWTTTATWNTITGSGTYATVDFTFTTDSRGRYQLWLRPSADDAATNSYISELGVFAAIGAGEGIRLASGFPLVFTAPFRCRIAAIADGADKRLYINSLAQGRSQT